MYNCHEQKNIFSYGKQRKHKCMIAMIKYIKKCQCYFIKLEFL